MSEMLNINMSLRNAAFADEPTYEIARILRALADRMEGEGASEGEFVLRDINGNPIGKAVFTG